MATVSDLVVASAQVKGGRLHIRNRRAFDDQIAQLPEKWELELLVKRLRATRSQQANRFYWSVVVEMIHEYTGYTPDEVHDLLKMMFLPKRLAIIDGNGEVSGEYVLGGSTREMDTAEFGAYIEEICQWAAETLHVIIPDPEQGRL